MKEKKFNFKKFERKRQLLYKHLTVGKTIVYVGKALNHLFKPGENKRYDIFYDVENELIKLVPDGDRKASYSRGGGTTISAIDLIKKGMKKGVYDLIDEKNLIFKYKNN